MVYRGHIRLRYLLSIVSCILLCLSASGCGVKVTIENKSGMQLKDVVLSVYRADSFALGTIEPEQSATAKFKPPTHDTHLTISFKCNGTTMQKDLPGSYISGSSEEFDYVVDPNLDFRSK